MDLTVLRADEPAASLPRPPSMPTESRSSKMHCSDHFPRLPVLFALASLLVLTGCGSPAERAQGYYERGLALIEKKDDVHARHELLNAVKYQGEKIEAWRALAGVDERTGAVQALYQDLLRVVELDPKDLDARLKLGQILFRGSAFDAALKVLDVPNDGGKPNAALHALRATILMRTRDGGRAVTEAQRAFEIDPGNVDAVTILASKKVSEGDSEGALKLLNTLRGNAKEETQILLLMTQIYGSRGDLKQAEASLRKLIALNPVEPKYQAEIIQLLLTQKRYDEAETEFRGRVAANASDTKAGLDLVRFISLVRGADAGRLELEKRIMSGGDVLEYQLALVELDIVQGKVTEATRMLQELIETSSSEERKIRAQLKLAELYIRKDDTANAEPIVSAVIAKDKRNSGALKLRSAISIQKGQIDSAVADLREALNDQPKAPDLLLMLALAYERGGKGDLADRQYADSLKFSGQNLEIGLRYSAFLQRRGDLSRAEDVLRDAVVRYPGSLQAQSALAQLRLNQKNWGDALASSVAIKKLPDGAALADQIRAAALAGQDKIEESISALEDAHRAAPDAVQPVVSLVSAYTNKGKTDKAIELLQDVRKKFPTNAQVAIMIGQTRAAQGKDVEALQSFKEAVSLQPKDTATYGALSEFYIRNKNYDGALDVLNTASKEFPDNINIKITTAGVRVLKEDHEEAIAQYEGILKEQPNSPVAINNLASLLLDYRSDKASLARALSLADSLRNSEVPQFRDTFGWSQFKRGDYNGAISTLEAVALKLPNLAAVHYHLGASYAAAGKAEQAKAQFELALSLEPDGTALKKNIISAMK